MDARHVYSATLDYGMVDREERLLLSGLFTLLQEAAIRHANQYDTGNRLLTDRGESWVLNRIAVGIQNYPTYEDTVRVETWSRGITGFRGYREYRVYRGDTLLASASSLWIYVNLRTKTPLRVPEAVITRFPQIPGEAFEPGLDRLPLTAPAGEGLRTSAVSLRYGDVDPNLHVNNVAYVDFIQSALAAAGHAPRPRELQLKFIREIPPELAAVEVVSQPAPADDAGLAVSIQSGPTVFATGRWVRG